MSILLGKGAVDLGVRVRILARGAKSIRRSSCPMGKKGQPTTTSKRGLWRAQGGKILLDFSTVILLYPLIIAALWSST